MLRRVIPNFVGSSSPVLVRQQMPIATEQDCDQAQDPLEDHAGNQQVGHGHNSDTIDQQIQLAAAQPEEKEHQEKKQSATPPPDATQGRPTYKDEDFIIDLKQKPLGQGSWATVFPVEARDGVEIHSDCGLVMKLFSRKHASGAERAHQSYLRELKVYQFLNLKPHRNVLRLYHHCEIREGWCLIFDRAAVDLCTAINEGQYVKLPNDKSESDITKDIIRQFLLAIYYLHKSGIGHNDIKTENTLLVNGVPTIADFGEADIAKRAAAGHGTNEKFLAPKKSGTPQLWSPELHLLDFGDYHNVFSSDCWAAGVVLFNMLTREYPYDYYGKLGFKAIKEAEYGDPLAKGKVLAGILKRGRDRFEQSRDHRMSPEAQRVIVGLLEYDPKKRWTIEQALCSKWLGLSLSQLDPNAKLASANQKQQSMTPLGPKGVPSRYLSPPKQTAGGVSPDKRGGKSPERRPKINQNPLYAHITHRYDRISPPRNAEPTNNAGTSPNRNQGTSPVRRGRTQNPLYGHVGPRYDRISGGISPTKHNPAAYVSWLSPTSRRQASVKRRAGAHKSKCQDASPATQSVGSASATTPARQLMSPATPATPNPPQQPNPQRALDFNSGTPEFPRVSPSSLPMSPQNSTHTAVVEADLSDLKDTVAETVVSPYDVNNDDAAADDDCTLVEGDGSFVEA